MRWEMRTRLFLRTSEFLWQEGHNAFATAEEAEEDAWKMLEIYRRLYEDFLAIPGICGEKTVDERFPGADHSYTIEGMMQDGKALQMCTSHNLGQNFARSFDIKYQAEDTREHLAHTTSWGLSTRSVGGLVMTHSDDDGLIAPPKIAPYQVAIIPVTKGDNAAAVMAYCETLVAWLKDKGLRVYMDKTDRRTPDKMWDAIKKGVPLRVEAGGREVEAGQVTHVRRDLGRESKTTCSMDEFVAQAHGILELIQSGLYKRAEGFLNDNITDVPSLDDMKDFFAVERPGFVKIAADEIEKEAFQPITKEFAVTSRCLPFADEGQTVIVGRAY